MKQLLTLIFATLTLNSFGQDKYNYVHFNKLKEVEGTVYVIASMENWGKLYEQKGSYLLFINTKTGETNQVDFPDDADIMTIEQVKLDSLAINWILVSGRAVDLNKKSGIDWNDPTQIFLFSTDGKTKIQLTDNKFFARTWSVNKQTGTIVITGHYDTNNNDKYDKTDKNEILVFDLKTQRLIHKL